MRHFAPTVEYRAVNRLIDVPVRAVAALNREGVKPFRGRAWNASTIHGSAKRASGMICNEIYRGVIVWNRVGKIRNPQTGRKVPRVNPRSEWQRIEAPHLRIVPEELWQETATRLAKARNANRGWKGVPPRRILSGLLRCGACGSSLVSAGSQPRPADGAVLPLDRVRGLQQ